jgi:hypothetical protein
MYKAHIVTFLLCAFSGVGQRVLSLLASVTHYYLLKGLTPFGTAHCNPENFKQENL